LIGEIDREQHSFAAGIGVACEEADIVPFGGEGRGGNLREGAGKVSNAASLPWHRGTVPDVRISCILKVKVH
jgi:hypothetical protein